MRKNVLGKESINKLFLQYSMPTIAAMLFLGLNTIVDGLFVGNYIGADALASVNIAMPFISFLLALCVVVGIGTQSVIGRKLGEGASVEANIAFKSALLLVGVIALLFTAVSIAFPMQIARFLGANEHLISQVATYISYLGLSLPFMAFMILLDYVLKTMTMPVYAMMTMVVSVSSHMLFNWLFIVKLALGIKGTALATGIGFIVAFGMAILPFLSDKSLLKPFVGKFDKQVARHILYNGSSEGLSEIGTGITTFLFNITLMNYVGEVGVAAFTIISYLSFIGNNVLIGLSDGVGSIISYNYGSRQRERVESALKLTFVTAFAIGLGIFITIFIFGKEVISLFLNDGHERVVDFAVYGAKLYAFAFFVNGLNIVAAGYFTAIGNPKQAVLIALSRGSVWIVVGIAVLPLWLGIQGIWLTVPLAEIITIILSGFLLYRHFKYQIHLYQ